MTASSSLNGCLTWPGAELVFRIERHFVRMGDGKVRQEMTYGVTSLTKEQAGPDRLLQLSRAHWGPENGLHYRRDETLREDRRRLRGRGAQAMASLNDLVLTPLRRRGHQNIPEARRYYAANPGEVVSIVPRSPV